MNNIDSTKKIQFPMEAANQEFLDLTLKFDKESKRISVDIFARAYNNFICVLPSTTSYQKPTLNTFIKLLRYLFRKNM